MTSIAVYSLFRFQVFSNFRTLSHEHIKIQYQYFKGEPVTLRCVCPDQNLFRVNTGATLLVERSRSGKQFAFDH